MTLVLVNPITLKPTPFPFCGDNPILCGPYQNAAEVTEEWRQEAYAEMLMLLPVNIPVEELVQPRAVSKAYARLHK